MLPGSFMTCVYRGARAAGAEYRSRSVVVCTISDFARPSTGAYQVPTQDAFRQPKGRHEAGLFHLEPNSCQYRVAACPSQPKRYFTPTLDGMLIAPELLEQASTEKGGLPDWDLPLGQSVRV